MNLYNTSNYFIFKIFDFQLNKPLHIFNTKEQLLSCQDFNNVVDFFDIDDNSGKQKWIIEKKNYYENIFYIKTAFDRFNHTNFLGSPNKDNNVYLYTSKNKFTEWSIELINESLNLYKINYIGDKFNNNHIQLIVIKISDNLDWIVPYNDISIIYDVDSINYNRIFLHHIINHYNNLPNKIIFCHSNSIINNLSLLFGIDNFNLHHDIQPLSLFDNHAISFNKIKTNYNLEYDTILINANFMNKYINLNILHDPKYPNLTLIEIILIKSSFPIKHFNFDNLSFHALLNSSFSISKSKILKYNLLCYQRLFDYISESNNDILLQYLWLFIFN